MAQTAATAGTVVPRIAAVDGHGARWNGVDEHKSAGGHMTQPIVYLDTSEVRSGRLAELKAAMNDLARFVQANEPQLLAYHVYFSDDGTRMSVLHINPDSASLERHIKVAGPMFPRSVSSSGCSPLTCTADRMPGW